MDDPKIKFVTFLIKKVLVELLGCWHVGELFVLGRSGINL